MSGGIEDYLPKEFNPADIYTEADYQTKANLTVQEIKVIAASRALSFYNENPYENDPEKELVKQIMILTRSMISKPDHVGIGNAIFRAIATERQKIKDMSEARSRKTDEEIR